MLRRLAPSLAVAVLGLGLALAPRGLVSRATDAGDFTHFESGHVRPAALTPDGTRLVVVNTPDNRLAVFDLTGPAPAKVAEVPVGLEPVSVACPDDGTAWVVNALSDDVSIVDLSTLHVRATLRAGDEPADVVFAGGLAFVSVSQEDVVRVFDPATLAPAGPPIPVNARFPRALARSADGAFIYVAGHHAGNRTSVLSFQEVQDSLPPVSPPKDPANGPAPRVGLVIQRQGNDWRDESGKLWNAKARYAIHDADVTEISTATRAVTRVFTGLGTVNFGLDVAADGRVALTATEARNLVRFEPNLNGHNVDTRVAFVTAAGAATVANLNPHVDYSVTPGPPAERDSAIGIPTGVAFSPDGLRAYVTSLASDRLAVVDPLAGGAVLARVPTVAGPTGVVVDGPRGRIYVVGRFRGEVQTLDAATLGEVSRAAIGFDPTPDAIVNGRRFFYGGFTSGHGEHACATCHVFGDFDNLAWDLGDPQGAFQPPPPGQIDPLLEGFHPMKGPMATQTLRGLPGTGILHWRGDRNDLFAFNGAFTSLLGRAAPLPDSEMTAFADFVTALRHPPNPNQFLDRSFRDAPPGTPSAVRGRNLYFNVALDGPLRCNDCHTANSFGPGTNGQVINDAALLEDQDIKVPQLRNMYRKTGFTDLPGATTKRGFGFIHDGSTDNLFNFLRFPGFSFGTGVSGDNARRDMEAFLLAFDTGLAPAVGAQVTFRGPNNGDPAAVARLDTLVAQAELGFCDLVAKGRVAGQPRGWVYAGGGGWTPDKVAQGGIATAALRGLGGPGTEVTVTGVPAGGGHRMGVDQDRDGHLDGDERDAGSDPANPASTPGNVAVGDGPAAPAFAFRGVAPNPFRAATEARFALGRGGRVDAAVHDVMGREVRALARGLWLAPGAHALRWDGRDAGGRAVPAGVYFVRVRTEHGARTATVVRMP